MTCTNCNALNLEPAAKFCEQCGNWLMDESEYAAMMTGEDGGESFEKAVAYHVLENHLASEAQALVKGLNEGTESLDAFIEKLQPETTAPTRQDFKETLRQLFRQQFTGKELEYLENTLDGR